MPFPLVAVDIGNNRAKFGLFAKEAQPFPEPEKTCVVSAKEDVGALVSWLADVGKPVSWWIASVNRPTATRLIEWLRDNRPGERLVLLAAGDLPLAVALPRPDMVGIDRLVDAVAANRLRRPDRPAIVVDLGTAITVDAVSAEGVFQGGAILPGMEMSARALHLFTDLLPLVEVGNREALPDVLGTNTVAAIESGLFWGTVGAIRELSRGLAASSPAGADLFLTGGAANLVAAVLGPAARYEPHLTLAGIALTAQAAWPKVWPDLRPQHPPADPEQRGTP